MIVNCPICMHGIRSKRDALFHFQYEHDINSKNFDALQERLATIGIDLVDFKQPKENDLNFKSL